jgi:hypothetical protein
MGAIEYEAKGRSPEGGREREKNGLGRRVVSGFRVLPKSR